ncbi:hypothetical protein [Xenorhabdus cabanillasii]|uniref:Uncharacterized protein n=1 Tax=Xenorhabdus cabanillasii JM26 TaxID=1427517 RepID=W1ISA0_9GAMM|nr:hypothetical protein [Xenorhabdus cabanillasii]PHM76933.1 hypothetical protein Xcab_02500 [Xenorhabdus cabanillasii JM26]CDL80100.1 conserved hypothetical protein [Xenorhabdus cabanillasii JM26]
MKPKIVSIDKYPMNNTVRRLRWLRKFEKLQRNPKTQFPITLYTK